MVDAQDSLLKKNQAKNKKICLGCNPETSQAVESPLISIEFKQPLTFSLFFPLQMLSCVFIYRTKVSYVCKNKTFYRFTRLILELACFSEIFYFNNEKQLTLLKNDTEWLKRNLSLKDRIGFLQVFQKISCVRGMSFTTNFPESIAGNLGM